MSETILCADIGTTSLKTGLISVDGEVVCVYTHQFKNPEDRFIAKEWLGSLKDCIQNMIKGLDSASAEGLSLVGAAISGNGPTLVSDQGLTFRWNEDCPPLEGEKSLFLPRIVEIKRIYIEEFERTQYLFSGPEFLIWQLTGNPITILPEERFRAAYWDDLRLEKYDIPAGKMPPFVGIAQKAGDIGKAMIEELGLGRFLKSEAESDKGAVGAARAARAARAAVPQPAPGVAKTDKGAVGTAPETQPATGAPTRTAANTSASPKTLPIFTCGPDFVAALIGTGTLEAGKICDRSGSSEGFNFCVPSFITRQGLRTLPSVIPGLWNASALNPGSGSQTRSQKLAFVTEAISQMKKIAADCKITFPKSIMVTGGQSKDSEYMKEKARATGLAFVESNCPDAELLGDAVCGATGLGLYKSLQEAAKTIIKETIVYENI